MTVIHWGFPDINSKLEWDINHSTAFAYTQTMLNLHLRKHKCSFPLSATGPLGLWINFHTLKNKDSQISFPSCQGSSMAAPSFQKIAFMLFLFI